MDERQDLVVDARTMNEGDGWAGSGANPWHLDKNTESILFLSDEGTMPVQIGLSITVENVRYYLTSLSLASGPQMAKQLDERLNGNLFSSGGWGKAERSESGFHFFSRIGRAEIVCQCFSLLREALL